jgi:hypothetical protein
MSAAPIAPRRAPAVFVALGVVAATLVLSRATESWEPMWGASELSGWAAALAIGCGLASLVGGIRLIARARPETERTSYFVGATGAVLALVIPLWIALGLLVGPLSVLLTIPYAVGLVGFFVWMRHTR